MNKKIYIPALILSGLYNLLRKSLSLLLTSFIITFIAIGPQSFMLSDRLSMIKNADVIIEWDSSQDKCIVIDGLPMTIKLENDEIFVPASNISKGVPNTISMLFVPDKYLNFKDYNLEFSVDVKINEEKLDYLKRYGYFDFHYEDKFISKNSYSGGSGSGSSLYKINGIVNGPRLIKKGFVHECYYFEYTCTWNQTNMSVTFTEDDFKDLFTYYIYIETHDADTATVAKWSWSYAKDASNNGLHK